MKASEVTPEVIGKRVSCIENGYRVTGTIIGIVDTEYELGVRIKFDVPLTCWSGDFNTESWVETEYDSTLAKHGVRDNLQYTRILETGGPMDWLESYRPKNEHFTTFEEVDMIVGKLGLADMTNEEVAAKRNEVVMFYHDLKEKAIESGDRNKSWDLSTAMMSVTAAIDHYKIGRGMEI